MLHEVSSHTEPSLYLQKGSKQMVTITVGRAENGYLVTDGAFESDAVRVKGSVYIAASQDDVAKVVKTILRGSFPEEEKAAPVKKKRRRKKDIPIEESPADTVLPVSPEAEKTDA